MKRKNKFRIVSSMSHKDFFGLQHRATFGNRFETLVLKNAMILSEMRNSADR